MLTLSLEQVDRGGELFLVEGVRSLIPRSGWVFIKYSAASAM
jgi:hypothetical protein